INSMVRPGRNVRLRERERGEKRAREEPFVEQPSLDVRHSCLTSRVRQGIFCKFITRANLCVNNELRVMRFRVEAQSTLRRGAMETASVACSWRDAPSPDAASARIRCPDAR